MNYGNEGGNAVSEEVTKLGREMIKEYRQYCKMRRSLENISMYAWRTRRKATTSAEHESWGHIIRFCEEAGVKPNILRNEGDANEGRK